MNEYNTAMLILRVCFGLTMAVHGYAKIFRGGKLAGTAKWFDSMGMRPGKLHARLAAGTELVAGVGLALGLFTTFSAMGFVGLMVVAAYTVHIKNGFLITKQGYEYNLILAVAAVGIAMLGPGEWSLDNTIGIDTDLDGWLGLILAAGGGTAAAVAQLTVFYRPPAT